MLQDIAPHSFHNEFKVPPPPPSGGDSAVLFHKGSVLLTGEGGFPTVGEVLALGAEEEKLIYLFSVDEQRFYLLEELLEGVCAGLRATPTAAFRRMEPPFLRLVGATAMHLANWYRANRFCGFCGAPTVRDDKERAMRCSNCGALVYPRINPAVVVAVRNGDRLLLIRYADRPMVAQYALIAGFTEIGETMAETARREVMEEVGLRVKNVRYHADQPWGFASNQMVGFWAELDGDDTVTLDTREVKEAVWLRREEIPESDGPIDLTHTMTELFRLGKDPR
ncbi:MULTISPECIES: NAD(+) diphosphatase [unclassified Oscillibacter]|uniref:NAD(+) diphosphatase n=1 Tax=unclassified Oscillibacter TaxID=2629304 RepID=UPI0025CDF9EC|nr:MULTISPECIES: NAD(+) diphosphatase [unclassified Oscillibacter]